jgi:hypothetical protein
MEKHTRKWNFEAPSVYAPKGEEVMNRLRGVSFAIALSLVFIAGTASAVDRVVIYGPTVNGGINSIEAKTATDLGFAVDIIATGPAWQALTATDFQKYRAIIFGDPHCGLTASVLVDLEANANVWGPLINGNVIIVGTDAEDHSNSRPGAKILSQRAVAYATAQPGKLGAYIALSCYYTSSPSGTPVPLLDKAFGPSFQVKSSGCFNTVHMTATSSALVDPLPVPLNTVLPLTDAALSNWSCSTHEIFETWRLDFVVLAIAVAGSTYTAPDGTAGTPYILARGDVKVLSDIALTPESAVNEIGSSHTLTATLTPAVPGVTVTFKVISGPNVGLAFTSVTDASGKATMTYASTSAGTDVIEAQFVDKSGKTQTSNLANKQWIQTPKSCLRLIQSQVLCEVGKNGKPTGNYVWKFRFQNQSGRPISHLFIANIVPAFANPDHLVFLPALASNAISPQEQVVIQGAAPGPLTLSISLHDDRLEECCSIPVTLDLPSCECGQIIKETTPSCFTFPSFLLPPPYRYTFQLQNLSPVVVENLLIAAVDPTDQVTPIPLSQLSVTKDVIPIAPVVQGGIAPSQTLSLSGPLAVGGQKVCLRIGLHEKDLDPCCSIVRCFTLPSCSFLPGDVTTLGGATLISDPPNLKIGNIGSSGADGVRIGLHGGNAAVLTWEPLDASGPLPNGAYFEFHAAGKTGEPVGAVRVTQSDSKYQVVTKIDGAQTYRVEVFAGANSVGAASGQNGINIIVIWPIAAGVELVPDSVQDMDTLGFTLETAHPIAWTLNDGSTLTGDRFRITPEQHGEISATLETLELRAASIPSIIITGTSVVHDCNGNGVPDSEDIATGTSLDLNSNGIPDECEAITTVSLNTGFDDRAGGLAPFGGSDDDWRVVSPGEERPAKVVNDPVSSWKTLANSRWISVDPNRGASLPNVTKLVFQRCFCLGDSADNITLDLRLRADNETTSVLLNGKQIGGPGGIFSDLEPLAIQRSGKVDDGIFIRGRNCLTVEVTDRGIYTGLDAFGIVTSAGDSCSTP